MLLRQLAYTHSKRHLWWVSLSGRVLGCREKAISNSNKPGGCSWPQALWVIKAAGWFSSNMLILMQ